MLESLRLRASRFGLDVIMIDLWEGDDAAIEATRYCEMWGIKATVLLDETAAYARTLGVRGVPTNVFVDSDGIVTHVGATTAAELLREAQRLAPGLRDEDEAVTDRMDRFSAEFHDPPAQPAPEASAG